MVRSSISILLVSLSITSHAQFTIPDPALAAALEEVVPDAVNGNVLDTTHASVLERETLVLRFDGIVNLSGVRFFTNLDSLDVTGNDFTSLPALPPNLKWLNCSSGELYSLPAQLPNGLQHLIARTNNLSSTPVLPNTLRVLDLLSNDITVLGPLPTDLVELNVQGNLLSSLPALPQGLVTLHAVDNHLTSLPELPAGLEYLVLSYNELTTLPALPASLIELYTPSNMLTSLPPLPNGLRKLSTMANELVALPAPLPDSLRFLHATYNLITAVPLLPDSLQLLGLSANQITEIPPLPPALEELYVNGNPLTCLPGLPNTLTDLVSFGTGITCLPNWPVGLVASAGDLGFAPTVCSPSDPCFLPQTITGLLFLDLDGDGQKAVNEEALPHGTVELQPGAILAGADGFGRFAVPVEAGTYTVQGATRQYHTITTQQHIITIEPGTSDTTALIGYQPIPGIQDLVADIQATPARPGFENQLFLHVTNLGTETTEADVQLYITSEQSYVAADPTPSFQSGTFVQWSVTLSPGQSWSAIATLSTGASVELGTPIVHTLNAGPLETDSVPDDNVAKWYDEVVGSYDPNDKRVAVDTVSVAEVQAGAWSDYTIRFQNTGTFLAEQVVITDTLSTQLDHSSMAFISASHNAQWVLDNGVLVFTFADIQLPDSVSDPMGSQGYVHFRMKLHDDLMAGEVIENMANIYFDFNEPVITEPAMTHIVLETSLADANGGRNRIASIIPNPVTELAVMQLPDPLDEVALFVLHDMSGREVWRTKVPAGTSRFAIRADGLEQGAYLFHLTTQQGSVASGTMVVAH